MSKIIEIPDMLPPYSATGECTFKRKHYLRQNGVYLIRDTVNGEWLYIGKGSCVYRQLYSHFQAYINRDIIINGTAYKNIAVTKEAVECCIILTKDKELLEKMLIKSLNPSLNRRIPKQEYEVTVQEPPARFMPHLNWIKVEQVWNDYILINGKEPF